MSRKHLFSISIDRDIIELMKSYNAPKVKTIIRPYFCRFGIASAFVDGIGKTSMIQSPRMLAAALAYQKAVKLMHVPPILWFHTRAIGLH